MGLFLIIGDSCSLFEDVCVCKNSWEDEEPKFIFKFIIALEHSGANEQWSLWSTAQMEDCSLGLLHSFGFDSFYYRQSTDDTRIIKWREFIFILHLVLLYTTYAIPCAFCSKQLIESFDVKDERSVFSYNLCWQPALRYKGI